VNRLKYIFTAIIIGYASFLQAQYTVIPDPFFEEFLISQGLDGIIDGQVLTANIDHVDFLQINEILYTFPIEDLTGIQDFASLEFLLFESSNCTSIDFGDLTNLTYLGISFSEELEEIDVSGCINLEVLGTSNCALNTLDVSQNLNLIQLALSFNNGNLNSIDVSLNTNLTFFGVSEPNLNEIDFRNGTNENIEFFNSQDNPNLTCIFVDDAEYSAANWTNIDPTTTFVETEEECEALSLEKVSIIEFSIYPNPSSQYFKIKSNQEITKVEIYNLLGKLVKTFKQNLDSYPIIDLYNGLYILNIQTNLGETTRKLIIK